MPTGPTRSNRSASAADAARGATTDDTDKPAPGPTGEGASPLQPLTGPVLRVEELSVRFGARRRRPGHPAVSDASLEVFAGESAGLVGESGSGKTTLGLCIAGLLTPTSGEVSFRGEVVNAPDRRPSVPRLRGVQIVFQDPSSTLNPRRTVGSVLEEILRVHGLCQRGDASERVAELLELVGLPPQLAARRPGRLSGGQRQRVAIARALALDPDLVVADEIVSALDASVQAQILNLLADLRARLGLTLVFISHALAVIRQVCDRVLVMHEGRLVESGSVDELLARPKHPYTRDLLAAVPTLHPPDAGAASPIPGRAERREPR